jgi:quinoprotein glucose dehydrogenase
MMESRAQTSSAISRLWRRLLFVLLVLTLSGFVAYKWFHVSPPPAVVQSNKGVEWPAYGYDGGGSRASAATQINRENVKNLKQAWIYRTGEETQGGDLFKKSAFETTPILVDGVLYLSTPFSRVIALDPQTGRELWRYDPKIDLSINYAEVTSRGVATWLDTTQTNSDKKPDRRIFFATIDARLIALDAKTGALIESFGERGQIDLSRDVGSVTRGYYQVTSPPAVIKDLVIVGSSIGDNRRVDTERGIVRAYEARTGKLRWSWDPIPRQQDNAAAKTWDKEGAQQTGAANVWSIISTDPERGLIFVPTSSSSPDFFGGFRRGANLYANSVVALNAESGNVVWHFQVVHHDLWDYDVPAQPSLGTIKRDGKDVPAVVVTTKMGHLFVLDRDTGVPLHPVEERPVPQTDVPGEETSPTQPFPVTPAPLTPQTLKPQDAWGIFPWDRRACRKLIQASRSEGVFTPPSVEGTILFPGSIGGMHWGGIAWEKQRDLVVLNTNRLAFMVKLIPRERYNQEKKPSGNKPTQYYDQLGTPYGVFRAPLLSPTGTPCNPPPWGTLMAVQLSTGEKRWEIPLGRIPKLSAISKIADWGSTNLGGPMIAGGVVFIAAAMDNRLRGFDIETGKELWEGDLPASAQATPMTYQLTENGKQFIVIAAGGHGKLDTDLGDYVVAFALP